MKMQIISSLLKFMKTIMSLKCPCDTGLFYLFMRMVTISCLHVLLLRVTALTNTFQVLIL
jgi:hypothetical protein